MFLYKYRDISCDNYKECYNLHALFNNYTRLNSRSIFQKNDPFDSRIKFLYPKKDDILFALKNCSSLERDILMKIFDMDKFRLNTYGIQYKKDFEKGFFKKVDSYKIYCLSSSEENYYMWESNYAKNHTGFCIEFYSNRIFTNPPRCINYSVNGAEINIMPLLKMSLLQKVDEYGFQTAEKIHELLCIKLKNNSDKCYSKEKEYRYIDKENFSIGKYSEDKQYNPYAVSSIIFGAKMWPEIKKYIIEKMPGMVFKQEVFLEKNEIALEMYNKNRHG